MTWVVLLPWFRRWHNIGPMANRTSDPCRVRYGFWRLHALGLAAAGPVHGGGIRRALGEWGVPIVVGTLMPALQQMVEAGLLERVSGASVGSEKHLRITPRGRQEIADLRPYLVSLADLIDGKSQPDHRNPAGSSTSRKGEGRGFGRLSKATSPSLDGLAGILDTVRNSERERTQLRAALEKMQAVIADALAN